MNDGDVDGEDTVGAVVGDVGDAVGGPCGDCVGGSVGHTDTPTLQQANAQRLCRCGGPVTSQQLSTVAMVSQVESANELLTPSQFTGADG